MHLADLCLCLYGQTVSYFVVPIDKLAATVKEIARLPDIEGIASVLYLVFFRSATMRTDDRLSQLIVAGVSALSPSLCVLCVGPSRCVAALTPRFCVSLLIQSPS
jgi:hypothetical protein